MARADVTQHPLRFRGVLDGLPGNCVEAINLDNVPALGFGIQTGAALVMLGTLPLHLVFGGDPNPDADALDVLFRAHTLLQ